jgi:hypothetical protein
LERLSGRVQSRWRDSESNRGHYDFQPWAAEPETRHCGLDSLIELVSASTTLWLYTVSRSGSAAAERRAQQLVAVCFGVLALYVTVDAINTLAGGSHV